MHKDQEEPINMHFQDRAHGQTEPRVRQSKWACV